jgi:hypothetical protein
MVKRRRGAAIERRELYCPFPTSPNDLWCADYKGEFMLADRRYCYPLTITDFASRYLFACEAPRRGFSFRGAAYTLCGIAQKFILPHGITAGMFAIVVGFPPATWSYNLSPVSPRGFSLTFDSALPSVLATAKASRRSRYQPRFKRRLDSLAKEPSTALKQFHLTAPVDVRSTMMIRDGPASLSWWPR